MDATPATVRAMIEEALGLDGGDGAARGLGRLAATRPEDERGLTIALESIAAPDMIERCYAMWDRLTQKSS